MPTPIDMEQMIAINRRLGDLSPKTKEAIKTATGDTACHAIGHDICGRALITYLNHPEQALAGAWDRKMVCLLDEGDRKEHVDICS